MYFKVEAGTETFEKFQALRKRVKEVNNAAGDVAEKYGSKGWAKRNGVAFGGISCIQLESKPEGFRIVEKARGLYYPNARNKEATKEFSELPTISYDEINAIIGYEGGQTFPSERGQFGMVWVNCFSYDILDDCVLIEIEDKTKYEPIKDCVEILASEFHRIKEQATAPADA